MLIAKVKKILSIQIHLDTYTIYSKEIYGREYL